MWNRNKTPREFKPNQKVRLNYALSERYPKGCIGIIVKKELNPRFYTVKFPHLKNELMSFHDSEIESLIDLSPEVKKVFGQIVTDI